MYPMPRNSSTTGERRNRTPQWKKHGVTYWGLVELAHLENTTEKIFIFPPTFSPFNMFSFCEGPCNISFLTAWKLFSLLFIFYVNQWSLFFFFPTKLLKSWETYWKYECETWRKQLLLIFEIPIWSGKFPQVSWNSNMEKQTK